MEVSSLPLEPWRVILSYLPLPDLGRCSRVCWALRDLILSLDKTCWRQLCLSCPEWRHPNWPTRPDLDPPSWREALRTQAMASRTWTRNGPEPDSPACFFLFRRRKDRRTWRVGPGLEHKSLRGALSVAGAYDRVVLQPGVYEEQTEVVLKVPMEIVGEGRLGKVALVVSIDQQCPTARLCNLVLMPAWFSPVVYKTSSGHVQLDNCNLEGGQIQVRGPGTCQARYCSFGQASGAHFQGVALSLLESCDFSGSDTASVTVERPPASDRNWAFRHLAALAKSSTAPFSSATSGEGSAATTFDGGCPLGAATTPEDLWKGRRGRWCTDGGGGEGYRKGTVIEDGCGESEQSEGEEEEGAEGEKDKRAGDEASGTEAYKLSYSHHCLSQLLEPSPDYFPGLYNAPPELLSLQQELQRDQEAQALVDSVQGCLLRHCLFRDGKTGVLVCNRGQAWVEDTVFRRLTSAVRCIQNAKVVMLRNEVCGCRGSGVFFRLHARGLIAENNIHSNAEAGLDIRRGANPIILCNRIHSGLRSGIVVLGNGEGSIRSNQIYGNKEAGIYILYYARPVVRGNHIFQGQAAGIAVNENARGMISENVIRENQWGGIDIRRGADPYVTKNVICHGYSDGVVVGERGRGNIQHNYIYCNSGCGVWVMSSSIPHLFWNSVSHNRMYGVGVFCREDSRRRDAYPSGQGGGGGGAGGGGGRGGGGENVNVNEDAWESDMESDGMLFYFCPPISVAQMDSNWISHNGDAGLYVKSNKALNITWNMVLSNGGVGVALLQSAQLSRLAGNCICSNGRVGITVAAGCRMELRNNGVYDNAGPGISSRGDGLIVENDLVGNRGCGLRLRGSADIKVLSNRIQSVRGCGIAVLGQVTGVVQENLVFQGWDGSTKPLLHRDLSNNTCELLNNTLLTRSRKSNRQTDPPWALENPPPRPQPEARPRRARTAPPAQRNTIATRIRARVESGCHDNSSIFCDIL
ncbi:F-box only protein 10-like [Conger conger]|uniref:F-box only protein 10-like n=1 Tax=Conger conger TaxID=82655 RepID=UPI002A59F7C9|nr:F-box only protein 10-like [Conger conger]